MESRSAWVKVWLPVNVATSPGASVVGPPVIPEILLSVTTILLSVVFPVFVTVKVYEMVSPTCAVPKPKEGTPTLSNFIADLFRLVNA